MNSTALPRANETLPPVRAWNFSHVAMNVVFLGFHVAAVVLAAIAGVSWWGLGVFAASYCLLMFSVTGILHRYFSHKTYRTSRVFQFFLGVLSVLPLQKGPIWWAAHHRNHHKNSDQEGDMHSPRDGLFWAHMGWIMSLGAGHTEWKKVPDLVKYPELRFLNHYYILVFAGWCTLINFTLGFEAMAWGCFAATAVCWHCTWTINSLAHVLGKPVYETGEDSKNNFWLALLTFGEGWHNNHHYYQSAAHQGFHWWQIDLSYCVILVMEKLGLIWGVKRASAEVIAGRLGGKDYLLERLAQRADLLETAAEANALGPAVEVETAAAGVEILSAPVEVELDGTPSVIETEVEEGELVGV